MCDCETDLLSALPLLRLMVVDEHLGELIRADLLTSQQNSMALSCFSDSLLKQLERVASTRGTGGFPEPLTPNRILNPPSRSLFVLSRELVLVNGLVDEPRPTFLLHRSCRATNVF